VELPEELDVELVPLEEPLVELEVVPLVLGVVVGATVVVCGGLELVGTGAYEVPGSG
jgi:hypothetical protein